MSRAQKARGAVLLLCALGDRLRAVLVIAGFDRFLAIHPSKADALASLDR
ncbi:MAG: hypothetical protein OXC10_21500 [Rhodospirillaceae bacterium]|nr:hypothetical protein [Rhodospirillaceae bacterium]